MEFSEFDNPLFSYQKCNRTYFVKATTIDEMRRISGTKQFHEREVVMKLKKENGADTALKKMDGVRNDA